jgi:exosortase/archaeosortase family protein
VLTATASWPASHSRLIRFVLSGVLISVALFGLVRLGWTDTHLVLPLTLAEAALAARLFGAPAAPIDVTSACSGVDVLSLCLGTLLAYPAAWRRRIAGALGAIGLILALNIVRIGTLGRAAGSAQFDLLHLYLWPAAITLAIAAYVFAWMNASEMPARVKAGPAGAGAPNLPRRFILFAGAFLLAFLAAAPIYLNSAVVLKVASFIARTAAATLGVAGIQAYAAANTLWMARGGGFMVTEECIATPLIPVYLAGIAAFARNWKQRSLGFAAAIPLFIALGVVRLLVVALPSSVAAQSFFVHAFFQLLSGALCIVAAACWRHRDRAAAASAAYGLLVGALCIWVAGPAYLRLIASIAVLPANDPQGAIAFLPIFQVALYLALWTAGFGQFVGAGWKRFAAGLALLLISQMLGLMALDALRQHAGLTMAVRDVRGWAIAAPVIIFMAAVRLGRERR